MALNTSADPMISADWLSRRLQDGDLAVLDGSWFMPGSDRDARAEFARGHIPGAVFFDIDAVSDQTSNLPHMLPSPSEFAASARRLGVGADDTLIVYDSQGLFSAPRVWWTFRAMGHAKVFVLDGGLPAWIAGGYPLETGWRTPTRAAFKAKTDPALVRDLKGVRSALASGDEQLLDARPAARFAGAAPEPRPGLRGGHMPGALNAPFTEVVTHDGRLASAEVLRAAFHRAGLDLERPIVATCGSGISAAVLALALARLGRDDVAVYDGSWAEWGGRDDTPVVTGR
ncbi:MAG TPA: 3-mercaptopyruvate sulfurtransferase [Caulobacteraceae bacterium]